MLVAMVRRLPMGWAWARWELVSGFRVSFAELPRRQRAHSPGRQRVHFAHWFLGRAVLIVKNKAKPDNRKETKESFS